MDKDKALAAALSQIERNFGKGTVMRFGEGAIAQVEAISTGSLGLDIALGIGGLPKGRIVEVFGPESSGKTTLALHVVAEAQKNGGVGRLRRRRACARSGLRQEARREGR
jgi:recombination protein RecA